MIPVALIAPLLARANAHAGGVYSREFYELKQRLLEKHGRKIGEDVQRIVHHCWGYVEEYGCQGAGCRRCGGTGIWMERWILLERWELRGRIFHRPVGPTKPRAVDFIDGRIRHRDVDPYAALDAGLWLYLFFDRRLFARAIVSSYRYGWTWRPMVLLQKLAFQVRHVITQLTPRRCSCGRSFRPLFESGYWYPCRACYPRPVLGFKPRAHHITEELPF